MARMLSQSDKFLSDKAKVGRERVSQRNRLARAAKHSTEEERAAAREEIADYLSRVPRPPLYDDEREYNGFD